MFNRCTLNGCGRVISTGNLNAAWIMGILSHPEL
jgi:hypothetical protein